MLSANAHSMLNQLAGEHPHDQHNHHCDNNTKSLIDDSLLSMPFLDFSSILRTEQPIATNLVPIPQLTFFGETTPSLQQSPSLSQQLYTVIPPQFCDLPSFCDISGITIQSVSPFALEVSQRSPPPFVVGGDFSAASTPEPQSLFSSEPSHHIPEPTHSLSTNDLFQSDTFFSLSVPSTLAQPSPRTSPLADPAWIKVERDIQSFQNMIACDPATADYLNQQDGSPAPSPYGSPSCARASHQGWCAPQDVAPQPPISYIARLPSPEEFEDDELIPTRSRNVVIPHHSDKVTKPVTLTTGPSAEDILRRARKFKFTASVISQTNPDDDGRYSCPLCSTSHRGRRVFDTLPNLRAHIRLHHDKGRTLSCAQCSKSFLRKQDLDRHTATHLPEEKKPHGCELCPMRFSRRDALLSHLRRAHKLDI